MSFLAKFRWVGAGCLLLGAVWCFAAESDGRVLHFPTDFAVGKISIQDANWPRELKHTYWANEGPWEYIGPAMGDMTIPADSRVSLIIYSSIWRDPDKLACLKAFSADDLHTLHLSADYGSPDDPPPTDACIPYITHLTGLKVLNLAGSHISQNGLKQLAPMTSLERIYLPAGLTNGGLAQVSKMDSLEGVFVMRNNRLADKAMQLLHRLPHLKELSLIGEQLSDEAIRDLAGLASLEYLFLNPSFGDAALKHLNGLPHLRIIYLYETPVTDAGMQHLSQIDTLEEIHAIRVQTITDAGIQPLQRLPNIKTIDMGRATLTDRSLRILSQMPTLESLDLPHTGFTDDGVAALANLKGLRHLWICAASSTPLTDRSLEAVGAFEKLEELIIGGDGFTDAGMAGIGQLRHLKKLSISAAPQVGDAGIAHLRELVNLEDLHWASETRVTFAGLSQLNTLKRLKSLSLRDIKRGAVALDLGGLESLESLSISLPFKFNRDTHSVEYLESFTDEDFACFAALKNLEDLQISGGEKVGDAALAHLQGLNNMIFLNIYGTSSITDAGLAHLTGMERLWRLQISGGHFTDKALDTVVGMDNLQWLELTSDTTFSNAAIEAFETKKKNLQKLMLMP